MNGIKQATFNILICMAIPFVANATNVPAQYPLFNVGRSAPNIMFTIDDSGSMKRDYMPESLDDTVTTAVECSAPSKSLDDQYTLTTNVTVSLCKASNVNHLYYNPSVTYKPRVNYLNQSLGNGAGTCSDPVFTETGASTTPETTTTTTTTKTYSNCKVTTIYKPATPGTPAQGSCTQTVIKDTQLAVDTKVPSTPAVTHQEKVETWVDDKLVTTYKTVTDTPAVPAYYKVPSGYQGSPYYTSTTTEHSTQYRYCLSATNSTKYKTTNSACNSTSVNNADCASYVPAVAGTSAQNGIAKCTLKTQVTTVVNGVTSIGNPTTSNNQALPQTKSDGTDGKCGQASCAANFATVGQVYNYQGTNPIVKVDGPYTTPAVPILATKTLNKTGVCEYLKYTPSGTAVSDDKTPKNYTHVMLNSSVNSYDSKQNGSSGRTDCNAEKVCTYAQEKQNFLNWQTYYKTRLDVSKTMIGLSFATLDTRFRVGFAKINSNPAVVRDVAEFTKDGESSPRALFFSDLYSINDANHAVPDSNPTPLRRAMDQVGHYFTDATKWDGSVCRQTYNITMTDGNWTNENATYATGNVDNETSPSITRPGQTDYVYSPAAPYKDDYSNTLADVAMYYWNHDLVSGLDNSVTASVADPAVWQHITQYTIGFGVQGRATAAEKSAGTWPDPLKDNRGNTVAENTPTDSKTDDLEHAAKNGHGDFFNASNPSEFQNALSNTLGAIDAASQTGSASMVAAVSSTYTDQTKLFQAGFEPGWVGRLSAFTLANNNSITSVWEASIPAAADRKIYTYKDTAGIQFLWDNLSSTQKTSLAHGTNNGSQILDYIRGDKSNEAVSPYLFRNRSSIFGDVINSNVAYTGADDYGYGALDGYSTFVTSKAQNTVYVGANDGMLHAFDANTGAEKFAYVPSSLLGNLYQLTDANYSANHRYFVDGNSVISDVKDGDDWKTILIGSTGAGGKALFGLNITDPAHFSASDVLWEISTENHPENISANDLGYSIPKSSLVRTGESSWEVLVPNGYGSANGSAKLLRIDPISGALNESVSLDAGTLNAGLNGLSSVSAVDMNGDGIADRVYAGDLKGNIWRINLATNAKQKIFTACDDTCSDTNYQPITTKLEIRAHPKGGVLILFGTGRYFTADDNVLGDPPRVEAVYGLRDNNNDTEISRSDLIMQQITDEYDVGTSTRKANAASVYKVRVISNNTVDYSTKSGWYLDLKSPNLQTGVGERVVSDVSLVDDKLSVSTLIPETGVQGNSCATGGTTWVMELNPLTGGRLSYTAFDINGDGVANTGDDLSVGENTFKYPSGVSIPGSTGGLTLNTNTSGNQKKIFSNLSGSISSLDETSQSEAEGRQAWRQIR